MNNIEFLERVYNSLLSGTLISLTTQNIIQINQLAIGYINNQYPSNIDNIEAKSILLISNLVYNNSDFRPPLDDSTYDILLEKYRLNTGESGPVGAPPVIFGETSKDSDANQLQIIYHRIPEERPGLFYDDIIKNPVQPEDFVQKIYIRDYSDNSFKITRNTPHNYPKLVGTLDKCKFVLNSQAREHGVFDDLSVRVFERDFIDKHIELGIIKPDEKFYMVAELKYDGISVEADVTDHILSARSRGDTTQDLATDLSSILEGYTFNRIANKQMDQIGMKFEAILTYPNLWRLSQLKGKEYKNCRNAIAGIIGDLDGRKYRDLLTLVPLSTSIDDIDRITEIEFLNKYYATGQVLNYVVLYGNYMEILFQVNKFAKEAEAMRPTMPFMYDGIVVSYLDKDKINKLGRVDSINKWQIAIKFNAQSAESMFIDYTYTVGQNGVITPMIHYLPVEFFGTIHTKSSGHSYDRFKELNLAYGDIITVTYRNDVMPYVTKDPLINKGNPNPPVSIITHCPSCGTQLVISDSGKTLLCPNIKCPDRNIMRIASFMAKLNIKDFSEETLRNLKIYSINDLLAKGLNLEYLKDNLGEILGEKFYNRINELLLSKLYDYEIIGSIGFTGIAKAKWKLIFKYITLDQLLNNQDLSSLISIHGIGNETINTIINEIPIYSQEISILMFYMDILSYKDNCNNSIKIRFTGFRSQELIDRVKAINPSADIGEGSVTKDTDILLIPIDNYKSSKVDKAIKYNIKIITLNDFNTNLNQYLN